MAQLASSFKARPCEAGRTKKRIGDLQKTDDVQRRAWTNPTYWLQNLWILFLGHQTRFLQIISVWVFWTWFFRLSSRNKLDTCKTTLVSKHSKIGIPEINKKINQSSPLHTSTLFDVQYNSIWGARQMSSRKNWKCFFRPWWSSQHEIGNPSSVTVELTKIDQICEFPLFNFFREK